MDLAKLVRDIPDWPKPGILFKDITPLLGSPSGLAMAVELMANPFRGKNIEVVVGTESRGFIFGVAVAQALAAGFVPVRKPKKLPSKTLAIEYDLEYGKDRLEVHADAIKGGQRVLMVDDLLATGGTMRASCQLLRQLRANIIGISILIELVALGGRKALEGCAPLHAVMQL